MKQTSIFIILIMIFSLSMIGCKKEEKPNYNYTNYVEESVKKEKNEPFPATVDLEEKVKKDKEQYNSEGISCWFVVWELKNKPSKVNSFIMQPHKGFSMKEFKEKHGEDTFIVNLVEVSYGTYLINSE